MSRMLKAVQLQLFQPKIFVQVRRLIQTIDGFTGMRKAEAAENSVKINGGNNKTQFPCQILKLFFFLLRVIFLWFDVKMAVARTVLALMEERVTRPATSSANVSHVNAVCMQQGTSVKLVQH